MPTSKRLAIVFVAALAFSSGRTAFSQPLLQEGNNRSAEPADFDAKETQRQAFAGRRAQLEEERRLKLQQELMRLQGERTWAEQERIQRRDVMMRYALLIAIAVIVITLLTAFARSRTANAVGAGPE